MYKAFHMKLPYNLQKHFLSERTDYEAITRQNGSFTQAYGNPICSATDIQQGDHLGPVLLAMAVD